MGHGNEPAVLLGYRHAAAQLDDCDPVLAISDRDADAVCSAGHKLTKFAGKYKVDVLKADGTLDKTEGPFEKDKEYEFNEKATTACFSADTGMGFHIS